MVFARPSRLGSEKLNRVREAPNRLFDSTLNYNVRIARGTLDLKSKNSFAQPGLHKEESHPPMFQRVMSNDSDEFPGFLNTDEGIDNKMLPYFRLPNFLVLLK